MPQQWWIVLREHTRGAGNLSPQGCNGLINRLWPQPNQYAHAQAKPFVLHGLPQQVGDTFSWSLTWLPDREEPPTDLRDQIGRRWQLGSRHFDVESVTAGPRRPWAHLLQTTPITQAQLRTLSPVLTAITVMRGEHRQRIWTPYPASAAALFGSPPRPTGKTSTSSHRQHGALSLINAHAAPDLAAFLIAAATRALQTMTLRHDQAGYTVRYLPGPGEHVWAWSGQLWLQVPAGYASGLAILAALSETTGIGRSTAYGFGSVAVATAPQRTPANESAVGAASAPLQAVERTDDPDEEDDLDPEWADLFYT